MSARPAVSANRTNSFHAILWLEEHESKIAKINDISGEHTRDLDHAGHVRGIDMDVFHFHIFDENARGKTNYAILRGKVIKALNGDAGAKEEATEWVSVSRSGLKALIELSDVRKLFYAKGSSHSEAGIARPEGWAETLLREGKLTIGAKTLDTGLGVWSLSTSTELMCDIDHNDHIHISLDEDRKVSARTRRNMPDPILVMVLARLAVDSAYQKQGLGPALLRDALLRTIAAAHIAGIRAVLLHAMSDDAKRFYTRAGFYECPVDPMMMMITLAEVEKNFGSPSAN